MKYHRHLETIASADIAYVRKKDTQYQASWKRRGGTGAFFTIARPWDRLEGMLAAVQPAWTQYDLLGAIAVEGLSGPDGSVIACVRDLRRYLMLVEAEMTERLAAEEEKQYPDLYELSSTQDIQITVVNELKGGTPEDGGHHEKKQSSHYVINREQYEKIFFQDTGLGRILYNQVSPDFYILETFITISEEYALSMRSRSPDAPAALREAVPEILKLYDTKFNSGILVLNLDEIPEEERARYPTKPRELNDHEYQRAMPWTKTLYSWFPGENKWKLNPESSAWCHDG